VFGTEKEIEKIYDSLIKDLKNKHPNIYKIINNEKEIKYSKINGINKDCVIELVKKYKINFIIIYSDFSIINYLGKLEKKEKDNLRRQMALMTIMESKKIFGETKFVVFDKLPFSKSSWKKMDKTLNDKFNQKIKISCVDSKLKKGLQLADLIAGASRNFLKEKRHKDFFENNSSQLIQFQKSHKNLKLIYSKQLSKEDMHYCFYWDN